MSTSVKENSIEEEPFVITREELHLTVITQEPNYSYTREVSRQVPANDKDDGDGGYGDSTDESPDEGDNEEPIGVNKGIEAEDDDVFGLGQLLEQLNQFHVESDDDIQNEDNTCDLDENMDEFLEEGIGDDFHN
ncbi:hypothetical protein CDL15_Pgr019293 [Punica granatum]|uniref:Uncharacterized protein n=1 Tax=Punica granatum TaxID=22663 RepID=A0A218XRE8_PUNGR|nr:hypothetical protein CDL15_Pgr019293 [Punica granatum]